MTDLIYPATNIKIPANNISVQRIQLASYLSNALVFVFCILTIIVYKNLTFVIMGLLSGSVLFILMNKKRTVYPLVKKQIATGLASGTMVILFGILILIFNNNPIVYGILFILLGISILLAFIKIPHRFHTSQLFAFISITISAFLMFVNYYQLLTGRSNFESIGSSLLLSLIFILFSQSILLLKPDRGFLGMMTLNSSSSRLALRFFFYFIIISPILSFLVISGHNLGLYENYHILPLLVVTHTAISIIMNWLSTKYLYSSELELFLTREALRANNIQLTIETEGLNSKVTNLEKDRNEVVDKMNNRQSLADIISSQS